MKFVSYAQMHRDLILFSSQLPPLRGIIGIPRSGSMVAHILGLHLHLPVVDLEAFVARGVFPEAGERLKGVPSEGHYLLIDDTTWTGRAMTTGIEKVQRILPRSAFKTAVLYGRNEHSLSLVDFIYKTLGDRRFFEWNIWNHHLMQFALTDMDGVLCPDPAYDDDGEGYRSSITTLGPLFHPRKIGTIVTCRLEKWREETEDWLRRHHIEWERLVMMQYPTAAERREAGRYGHWKGEVYAKAPRKAPLFVESSAAQAQIIHEVAKRPVFCTETMTLLSL